MVQATQYWLPPEQSGVLLDSDATISDERSIQVWAPGTIPIPSGQPMSPQDMPSYLTGPDESSCMVEEQDVIAFLDDYHLHHYLANIKLPVITNHFSSDGNTHEQPGDGQVESHLVFPSTGALVLFTPSKGAVDSPTSWSMSGSSPQSPVVPSAPGSLSSQDFRFQFGGNEHGNSQVPWPLLIPSSAAAGPPTSSTTTTSPSAQSPVGPSAAGPHLTAEDDIRPVGSPQIQQAAARRRKNDGIYQCTLPNCDSTFTKSHNLQYHIYAHMGLKPYKCSACEFATAYPTTLGQHVKRTCKGRLQLTS